MTRPASLEVALIAPATVSTLLVAVALPSEATAIEWEISLVATSCSSTAEAIACMKLSISRTASLISLIAVHARPGRCLHGRNLLTDFCCCPWRSGRRASSPLQRSTAKPFPASPALAAVDGRVESQEIGLLGYCVDHLNDGARSVQQRRQDWQPRLFRPLCGLGRTHGPHSPNVAPALGNFTNGSRKFLRGCGNGLYF